MVTFHTTNPWLALIVSVGILVFWWWTTRYLSSITTRGVSLILRATRLVGLYIIVLLLVDFQIQWTERTNIPPTIPVYVDHSQSMESSQAALRDSVEIILKKIDNAALHSALFVFNGELGEVRGISGIQPGGNMTDLSLPLKHLTEQSRDENYQAAILLSDGIHNSGPQPDMLAQKSNIPVFTMFIGDSVQAPDLAISEMILPSVVYAEDTVQVQVKIQAENISSSDTTAVTISRNDNPSYTEKIAIPAGSYIKPVQFPIRFSEPGEYSIRVETDTVAGEENRLNNHQQRQISVKPGRYTVQILSPAPSLETRFLISQINHMQRFRTETFFQGSVHQDSPDNLGETDILYVLGENPEVRQIVNRLSPDKMIRQVGTGGNLFTRNAENITVNSGWTESTVELSSVRNNPLRGVNPDKLLWGQLPPVWGINATLSDLYKPLLTARETQKPFVAIREGERTREVIILARDLWRWTFALPSTELQDGFEAPPMYKMFLEHLLYWLLRDTDFQRLQVNAQQSGYSGIQADAQVYLPSLALAEVARVWGEVIDSTGQVIQRNTFTKSGKYFTFYTQMRKPGSYQLKTTAYTRDDTLTHISGPIHISDISYETMNKAGDPDLLQRISTHSGGKHLTKISDFPSANYENRSITRRTEQHAFVLRKAYWAWILLVVLLAGDWWIRRRTGIL